jgi:hypothetical protein
MCHGRTAVGHGFFVASYVLNSDKKCGTHTRANAMGKCTQCGAEASFMNSLCDSCMRTRHDADGEQKSLLPECASESQMAGEPRIDSPECLKGAGSDRACDNCGTPVRANADGTCPTCGGQVRPSQQDAAPTQVTSASNGGFPTQKRVGLVLVLIALASCAAFLVKGFNDARANPFYDSMTVVLDSLNLLVLVLLAGGLGLLLTPMARNRRECRRVVGICAGAVAVVVVLSIVAAVAIVPHKQVRWLRLREVVVGHKMKQLMSGIAKFESARRRYPSNINDSRRAPSMERPRMLLSWRVAILRYLDEEELYQQFHLDEPWDSPHNITLLGRMPRIYACDFPNEKGETRFVFFVGGSRSSNGREGPRMAVLNDDPSLRTSVDHLKGTDKVLGLVQAGMDKAVPWTKPEDIPFDVDDPLRNLGETETGGFLATRFDGWVGVIPKNISPRQLAAMIDIRGDEEDAREGFRQCRLAGEPERSGLTE